MASGQPAGCRRYEHNMKLSPQWLRDFVDLTVDNHRLAENLTSIGLGVEGVSGEGDNIVWEMEIGTNRPDAMNHYGIAREAAALYDASLKPIQPKLPNSVGQTGFKIEVEEPGLCPRFTGRVIRNVQIKASPEKIAHRLQLLDQRPINNAVDATNYTLWEMGKPTHVFDLDLLEGGKLIIRRARDGETLKTLDGVERKLTPEDLVVADAVKPVGLAGVMGGFDTMITDKTRNILIESAWWDPAIVRAMSRRHGLHTDASHRFERGADFDSTTLSCDRVGELILQSAGGELIGDVIDVVPRRLDQAPIGLRVSEVHRILGPGIDTNQIVRILKNLGFELLPEPGEDPEFTVSVPSWRLDVEREIDLIEEIARLHGYDKFSNTLPSFIGFVVDPPNAKKDEKLRTSLLALGYNEAVSLTFISHRDAETFSEAPVLELENPQSEEASVMRTSLVPGMLNMIAHNLNRGIGDVRLFEAGAIFQAHTGNAEEVKHVCFAATGNALPPSVHQPVRPVSFYDVKGNVETLLHGFQHSGLSYQPNASDYYRPGRSARIIMDGNLIGQFGQLHPELASARKLRQELFLAELYLDRLYQYGLRAVRYQPLAKYPAVDRDFSFIFSDAVVFESIRAAAVGLVIPELRDVIAVETFRGGSIPAGKYSLLLRTVFQSNQRTLRDEEVATWSAQIAKALESLGGTQRA
jgi:phenylalanyl-tRNA synthetase beta chain